MSEDPRKKHHRRRVEHARAADRESSPRTADAATAGESEFDHELGYLGVQIVKAGSSTRANNLTKIPDAFRKFGSRIRSEADLDAIPSRLEAKQEIAADENISIEEVDATSAGEYRRDAIIDQLGTGNIRSLAKEIVSEDDGENAGDEDEVTATERSRNRQLPKQEHEI